MEPSFAFNIILVCGLLSSCCYLLIKRRNNPKYAPVCDPQLKTVMDFMNWSLIDLLERLSKPIDDSLENEYGENMYLLREQAGRHLMIVTEYNSWVKSVSEYPGWAVHIMGINGDYEEDYYKPWSIMVSTGLNTTREFIVRQQNIMHLIDCLESMNNYNEKLVEMIKGSE
jgi:hypothetical protein